MTEVLNDRKQTILVVDDTPDILSVMVEILGDLYKVKIANNGEKALRIARMENPPDLILLDVLMPGMDGYEVCRQLKSDPSTSRIPVIFLTSRNEVEDEKFGLELGAVDYISKPLSPPVLLARVKTHLSIKRAEDLLKDQNLFLEQEIEKRTREVQNILKNIKEAVIALDTNHRIIYWNDAAEQIFLLSQDQAIGMDYFSLIKAEENGIAMEDIIADSRTPLGWQAALRIVNSSGVSFHVEASLNCITDSGGAVEEYVGIIRDVTESVKAEEKKRDLEKQISQVQRLETIGTLAGGIAHDFNNILVPILGYGEMIKEDAEPGSQLAGDIEQIINAAIRAKDLIRQILTFSRQGETTAQPLQLKTIVNESVKLIRASIPATIRITAGFEDELPMVNADPSKIHSVVMNLCTNAFHAMEEKGTGTLNVSLKTVPVGEITALLSEHELMDDTYVLLKISDTGCGMTEEVKARVFEPFFTTKTQGKGTGLGLAMVHGIVKSYHGFVDINSVVGEGTDICIYIPVIKDRVEEVKAVETVIQTGNERILIVDDEPEIIKVMERVLKGKGYRITACATGEEVLQKLSSDPAAYDVLISDATMPDCKGVDLIRKAQEIVPGLPAMLVSGYSYKPQNIGASDAVISAVIRKPINFGILSGEIRKLFDV